MNRQEVQETINNALAEEFELEKHLLVPQAHIKDDLHLDSLDIVDMVIVLEKAFNFTIKDKAALQKIQTLGDVVDFIEALAADPAGPRARE